jgi:hypothetical protein
MQAEKDGKTYWINNLIDSFRLKINEPGRQVEVVDVLKEAWLSHLGIVPESRRFNTFLIDIGSGNTKGGYFPFDNTETFKLFGAPKALLMRQKKDARVITALIISTKSCSVFYQLLKIMTSFIQ